MFFGLLSIVGIIAVTTPIEDRYALANVAHAWRGAPLLDWWQHGWGKVPGAILGSLDGRLNVLLFIPAGICLMLALRRPRLVAAILFTLSFVLESSQAATGFRSADSGDLVTNTLGGVIGIGIAVRLRRVAHERKPALASPSLRHHVMATVLVTVTVATIYLYSQHRADLAHERLITTLHASYGSTTWSDIEPLLEDPDYPQSLNRFTRDRGAWAGSIGVEPTRMRVIAFYGAGFETARRCVFVTWTPEATEFRPLDGSACTRRP